MEKYGFEYFEKFHAKFKGDTSLTFPVCLACGGVCEYKKISSLLPGEAEFMAYKKNMPLDEFRDKYLDGFRYNGQVIDIIKCIPRCPLICDDFSCSARGWKPLMCLIYPIIFEKENDKWVVGVDKGCPLIEGVASKSFFVQEGKKMVEELQIPAEWIEIDYLFDLYEFDYDKMVEERNLPADKYKIFEFEEMLNYRT